VGSSSFHRVPGAAASLLRLARRRGAVFHLFFDYHEEFKE
jgi:hypothetical protein